MSELKDYAPLLLRLEDACLKVNTDPKMQLNGLIEMINSLTCEPIYKNIDIVVSSSFPIVGKNDAHDKGKT